MYIFHHNFPSSIAGTTLLGYIQLRLHRHFRIRNVRESDIKGPRGWERNLSSEWLERHGWFPSVHFHG